MRPIFFIPTANTQSNIDHSTVKLQISGKKISIFIWIDSCFLETGYVYNTEAHPIDIGAMDCCSSTSSGYSKNDEKTLLSKEQMRWLRDALLDQDNFRAINTNFSLLTCSALNFQQRFSVYGEIST